VEGLLAVLAQARRVHVPRRAAGLGETVPAGPAGADGAATVTLTPLHAYSQTLLVTGTFGDGTQSETRRYGFYANQITPQPQPSLASTEPQKRHFHRDSAAL
jgi:hypothetical protein